MPRLADNRARGLPSYLILGAQRGGTTALHVSLTRHPQVLSPIRKEIQFFDRFYGLGINWYRAHFPLVKDLARLPGRGMTGEATANYLFDPRAPARARATLPMVRPVVLLRNPVERAFSAWKLMTRQGREHRSFAAAVEAEVRSGSEPVLATWHRRPSPSYLARGRYEEQLRRWFVEFDRRSFLILPSERFFSHPRPAFTQITAFLDITEWQPEEFRPLYSTEPAPIDSGLRKYLVQYFEPHNLRLEALLGMTLEWE